MRPIVGTYAKTIQYDNHQTTKPSDLTTVVDKSRRVRESERQRIMLTDLPHELRVHLMVDHVKDHRSLQNLCRTNAQFATIGRDGLFWQAVLRARGWMPDWSAPHSPGGMAPKVYYAMICGLNDAHQSALLGLSLETTTIEEYAFEDCTSLALTQLPDTIVSIEEYAFMGCTSLALTELPPNLKSIGWGAFWRCTSLALTELPLTLIFIGNEAFADCPQLTGGEFEQAVLAINQSGI